MLSPTNFIPWQVGCKHSWSSGDGCGSSPCEVNIVSRESWSWHESRIWSHESLEDESSISEKDGVKGDDVSAMSAQFFECCRALMGVEVRGLIIEENEEFELKDGWSRSWSSKVSSNFNGLSIPLWPKFVFYRTHTITPEYWRGYYYTCITNLNVWTSSCFVHHIWFPLLHTRIKILAKIIQGV